MMTVLLVLILFALLAVVARVDAAHWEAAQIRHYLEKRFGDVDEHTPEDDDLDEEV